MNRTAGRCSIACAISSRRIIPPEYCRTSCWDASLSPTSSSASAMRVRPVLGAQAVQPRGDEQILVSGQRPVGGERLGHVADPAPHAGRVVRDVAAGHPGLSRRQRQQRRQDLDHRALARAVRAEQPVDLAGADLDRTPRSRRRCRRSASSGSPCGSSAPASLGGARRSPALRTAPAWSSVIGLRFTSVSVNAAARASKCWVRRRSVASGSSASTPAVRRRAASLAPSNWVRPAGVSRSVTSRRFARFVVRVAMPRSTSRPTSAEHVGGVTPR